MKKVVLLLIICGILSGKLSGQITINHNDMPSAGDTLRYSLTTNPQQYNFIETGEDFLWDFSNLIHQLQGLEEYELVSSINFLMALLFFGTNSIATSSLGDLPLDNFDIELDGVYSVYLNSISQYSQLGFFALIEGFGLPLKYSENHIIYKFPLNYNDQDTTSFFGQTNFGDTLSLTREGYRINEVDGWGNIITPYGEFETLRLKSIIYESDSLFLESFGEPFVVKRTTAQYSWLAKNEKIPILEVSYTAFEASPDNPVLRIKYRDIYRDPSEAAPLADFAADITEAEPGEEIQFINLSTPGHDINTYTWSFSPDNVIFHEDTGYENAEPRVSFTEEGTYSVMLVAINQTGKDTLLREDYITVSESQVSAEFPEIDTDSPSAYFINRGDILVIEKLQGVSFLRIYDLSGRLVQQIHALNENNLHVNFSGQDTGIYLINFYYSNRTTLPVTLKVIKP
ncbi:MAG: T9SS C-terminal target domain-containing protein [Bacteroidetes bacterium]|nr:MAG: T9SS C-terminal target domain-containing protein [Bacteroidota bacterium]